MEKLTEEAALRAFGKWFREDPDFVFRSTAANYTLSNLQLAYILAQVSETEKNPAVLPHLVSLGYLQERKIAPGKCRSYRVPVPEHGEIRLFAPDMPCEDAFPGKDAMTEKMRSRMRRLDALAKAAEKASGRKVVMTDIAADSGKQWFYLDRFLMIRKDIPLQDFMYILLYACLMGKTRENAPDDGKYAKGDASAGIALKLLNTHFSVPEPVDLSCLSGCSDMEYLQVFGEALERFQDSMFTAAPTFTLNEFIAIREIWRPDMTRRELANALEPGQPQLGRKLMGMDTAAAGLLAAHLKQGSFTYTPAVVL